MTAMQKDWLLELAVALAWGLAALAFWAVMLLTGAVVIAAVFALVTSDAGMVLLVGVGVVGLVCYASRA